MEKNKEMRFNGGWVADNRLEKARISKSKLAIHRRIQNGETPENSPELKKMINKLYNI